MIQKVFKAAVLTAIAVAVLGLRQALQESAGGLHPDAGTVAPRSLPAAGLPPHPLRQGWLARLSREVAAFRRWAQAYAEAEPAQRPAMLPEGRQLARAHRERMKELIVTDPRRALEEAVPRTVRQALPAEIGEDLEERVNARGRYSVLGRPPGEGEGIHRRFLSDSGDRYVAVVYGRRVRQGSMESVALNGVAVDGIMAVNEDPLRIMEPGERLQPGQPVLAACPVSGRSTPVVIDRVTPETPAVETGGEVRILCSGGHIHVLNDQLKAAEGGTGGPSKPTGPVPATWSTGVKSVLYIRVVFPEQNTAPQFEKDAYDMMKQVNDFFVENSHGQLHFMTTVTPLIVMPRPEAWYKANDSADADAVLSDARSAARAAGYDYASYDLEAVRYSGASGAFSGQALVGARGCWLKSSSVGVACHEFGHNLGLWHANFWNTGGGSIAGSGTNVEYGNTFDTMGAASAGNHFFNAGHQNKIGWLPDANATRVTASGVYRIFQQDQGRIDPANRYLLAVKKDPQRDYWCEFRQRFSANRWLSAGVSLLWSPWGDSSSAGTAYGSNGGGQLLDTTPGSPDGKDDSALVIGRTFSDFGAQVHITPLAKGGTVPESIDVAVNTGAFPGNRTPALEMLVSSEAAGVNEAVSFTATASDSDGDPLAYSWDWGDRTFGPNAALAEKAWAVAGMYPVRCEVSDLRGGTRSVVRLVTVGSPALFAVSGRVLTGEGTPLAGARISMVAAGSAGAAPKSCLSDSAGFYAQGLPAGEYTVSGSSPAAILTPSISGPLAVTSAVSGVDFTAAGLPAVTMTLPDASCTEDGDHAVLRFTRAAGANTAPLEVRVFTGGSAGMGDVDFSPAETYELATYKFTVPAGADALDVGIAAFNDNLAEGPEILTLSLVDGSGYIPSGVESVTLTVNDNDTSLPVISLEALSDSAAESGGSAAIRLSRTGPVDSPFTVALTISGTAVPGADYTGIGTTATIPAGAVSTALLLKTLQDTAAEGSEIISVSAAVSSSWIRSPAGSVALVTILDDDIPAVGVTAVDSAAAEAGSDPAVFLFNRSGDLTAPLVVDYAMGGTAEHGTDYQPLSGTFTFPAGMAHAALTVTPVDDVIGELTQTVSVSIRSASRYTMSPAFSAGAVLTDNDVPHIAAAVSGGDCAESGAAGRFRIQASGSGAGNVTAHYRIGGTAVEGLDFSALSGAVEVPRSGYVEITVAPLQDFEAEDAESVILTLLPDAAYTIAPESSAEIWLTDDEQPLVSVSSAGVSYQENSGPVKLYFSRNGDTAAPLSVAYALGGTAAAGLDYMPPSGTVTIPAGSAGASVTVSLLDDTAAEGTETLICRISGVPGSYGSHIGAVTVYLTDNETAGLPAVNFASASSSAAEGAGDISIPVYLAAASASEVRVDYVLESGLAFNGVDYHAAGGTLFFAPGQTAAEIPVSIVDDRFKEPAESLGIRLVRAFGARTGSSPVHVLTISDNDELPPPVFGFTSSASIAGESAVLPPQALVYLSAPQSSAVSVAWQVSGGTAGAEDVAGQAGTLTFQPGDTVRVLPLIIADDNVSETPETVVVSLTDPLSPAALGTPAEHTFTLIDNDDNIISLSAGGDLAEGDPAGAVITVSRVSVYPELPVTVGLETGGSAASGSDFTGIPAEVTIPAGAGSVELILRTVDDPLLDPDEIVNIRIVPSGYYTPGDAAAVALTIADNETGVSIRADDDSAAEPGDAAAFLLTRTGPSAGELTVTLQSSGSAVAGIDYLPLADSVTFASGQTALTLTLTPVDDNAAEPGETLTVTLVPGSGYLAGESSATITIHDDDTNAAPVISLVSPAEGTVFLPAGPGLLLDAEISDDGRPWPASPLTVEWSKVSGPGSVTFGDSAAAGTSAAFGAPGPYVMELRVSDAELSSTLRLNVFVIGDSLTGMNIGTASSLTGIAGSGSAWTVSGAGSGVGLTATDGFYFAHRQMAGDFSVVTRVSSLTGAAGTSPRCGLMVRSALTAGAKHAAMSVTATRSSFVWRSLDNFLGAVSNTNQTVAFPRFLRLERRGNLFTAAHSLDGVTWTNQGSAQTIAMPDLVFTGLFATTGSTSAASTAVAEFDRFSLSRPGNVAPFVDAGPALTTGLKAGLAGVVADDAASPLINWLRLSGPGTVQFPSTASGLAEFSAPGLQSLRLIADDGTARTFDDTTVTVTAPFLEWQVKCFGGAAGSVDIAGPQADPDGDGLQNLVEYAFGSHPLDFFDAPNPVFERSGDQLHLIWRESAAAPDVTVEPEWSSDLKTWSPSRFEIGTLRSGPGWVEKRATFDASALRRGCLQLRVALP